MPLVSVTRLRVRSWRYLPGFLWFALRSSSQAKRAPGVLNVALMRDVRNTYWTCTAWNDESAMRAFMMARPHKDSMAKLPEWCDEASVVNWKQDTPDLPDWREAHRRMVAEGRRSRVKYPSAAHEAWEIPEPNA